MSFSMGSGYRGNYGPAGSSVGQNKIPGYQVSKLSQFTPEQFGLLSNLFKGAQPGIESGLGSLSKLASGDESQFAKMEAPAYRAFNQGISQIAHRFAGEGLGGLSSSAFQNAVTGAAGDLGENLQSRRMLLQQQAIQQLLGLGENLLGQRPYQNVITPEEKKTNLWAALLPLLATGGGAAIGSFVPGIGTLAGAKLGSVVGSSMAKGFS